MNFFLLWRFIFRFNKVWRKNFLSTFQILKTEDFWEKFWGEFKLTKLISWAVSWPRPFSTVTYLTYYCNYCDLFKPSTPFRKTVSQWVKEGVSKWANDLMRDFANKFRRILEKNVGNLPFLQYSSCFCLSSSWLMVAIS